MYRTVCVFATIIAFTGFVTETEFKQRTDQIDEKIDNLSKKLKTNMESIKSDQESIDRDVKAAQSDIKRIFSVIGYHGLKKYTLDFRNIITDDRGSLFVQRNNVWWENINLGGIRDPIEIIYNGSSSERDIIVRNRSADPFAVYSSTNPLLPSVPFRIAAFRQLQGGGSATQVGQPTWSNNWTLQIDFYDPAPGFGTYQVQVDVVVDKDVP
jgi:hypothetical protein